MNQFYGNFDMNKKMKDSEKIEKRNFEGAIKSASNASLLTEIS